jgi:Uma2 family endonuclease
MEAVIEQRSQYEIERNKPMPTLLHGAIQTNVMFELRLNYGSRFRIASEVLLDTQPIGSTPDVIAYPARPLDFDYDPSRRPDAPLLVVEIQSGSQSTKDMVSKLDAYFTFGVQSCWIVVPDLKAILVYRNADDYTFFHANDRLIDSVLGIEIELPKVFA